jgi:hypothetical protein
MHLRLLLLISLLLTALQLPTVTAAQANVVHPTGGSSYKPDISLQRVREIFENPRTADAYKYTVKDDRNNQMDGLSIMELKGQSHKYAAVYHTPIVVSGGIRFNVNLALSNDLINWTFRRQLIANSSMPKIGRVRGSDWIVVTHEAWLGRPGRWSPITAFSPSRKPQRVEFKLFYNDRDLVDGMVRSSYQLPRYLNDLNGTPNIYDMHLKRYGAYYVVDGQYGFHYWNGNRDVNAATTILQMFNPIGGTQAYTSTTTNYNNRYSPFGVTGNIGQRDTIVTKSKRYVIQEANKGRGGTDFDKWRIFLYPFTETTNYPTGASQPIELTVRTHAGSTSIGNPGVSVVKSPDGNGHVMVVSYFIFSQGARGGEAGPVIYYHKL